MGYGIDFTVNIFLSHMTFKSIEEVKEKVEENNKDILRYKEKLLMFTSSNLRDICDPDWKGQPIDWLHKEVLELFESLEEMLKENVLLELYIKYLQEK